MVSDGEETTQCRFIVGQGASITTWFFPLDENRSAIATARQVIVAIINPHLSAVFDQLQEIRPDSGGTTEAPGGIGLETVKRADSLLGCLYRHLADLVLDGPLLECRECGAPFVRRHGRQVFCPAPPWRRGGASRCSERWRKREHRKRQKASG